MQKASLVGDYRIETESFPDIESVFHRFQQPEFLALHDRGRSDRVNRALCDAISLQKEPCFLLPAVLRFVERVDREKILEHYTLTSFELWLNQYSNLSFEENAHIRGRIAGKWIERSDYQGLFPIGMGKVYEGSHFVSAHKSPDLDTTVASFWGWLDAFAARVGDGLHLWNLPGGEAPPQIEIDILFRDIFGASVFTHVAKNRLALSLTGKDLLSQKGVLRVTPSASIASIDHDRENKAVMVVDEQGFYLGDWRGMDVEGVRQVVILLSSSLRWFENNIHLQWISLLAQNDLHRETAEAVLEALFSSQILQSEPVQGFSLKEKKNVQGFIQKVLGLQEGLQCSFEQLGTCLARFGSTSFAGAKLIAKRMHSLFDLDGCVVEKRPAIFEFLKKEVGSLHESIFKIRERLEKLDIALLTKREVFDHHPTFVTVRSDVEEIQSKMGNYSSLTVVYPDKDRWIPVGAIHAADIRKPTLGTVSLRDFCNGEEMTIPSYLEVISVIDHHKSQLRTLSPPLAILADVQSCNTLVAFCAFAINDRTSLGGQTREQIENQMKTATSSHILQRLLTRKIAAASPSPFYIHPVREFVEYLHFLYAILDDTDLLSKVSVRDVECVVQLLNRLKTLMTKEESEVISLDDLPRDKNFPKKAAERILQNQEMYSLYRKIYAHKEKSVEENLALCAKGKPSTIFADTKEQNGCCRVGQTKLFASNFPFFRRHEDAIRRAWLEGGKAVSEKNPDIVFHLHMVSTIVSAEEVHRGKAVDHTHRDELWIWIPSGDFSIERLKKFLSRFQNSSGLKDNPMTVEFLGENGPELSLIFKESFLDIPHIFAPRGLPIAVLHYRAGSLNSRKAMVSPFLPTLVH